MSVPTQDTANVGADIQGNAAENGRKRTLLDRQMSFAAILTKSDISTFSEEGTGK